MVLFIDPCGFTVVVLEMHVEDEVLLERYVQSSDSETLRNALSSIDHKVLRDLNKLRYRGETKVTGDIWAAQSVIFKVLDSIELSP